MQLPEAVLTCIDMLERAGFQAYAVGGCVRDDAMGIHPKDYDLCTNARPEQTEAVFADFPKEFTGVSHGTVTVHSGDYPIEITTFRQDGPYSDGRRPDWVKFVDTVEEDLSRRDFTINAIAYSPARGYVDPFRGLEDIAARKLRTVGDPGERFREDPLRILRGIRFIARFDLEAEPETEEAMRLEAPLLKNLAAERVFAELSGALPHLKTAKLVLYSNVLAQVIPELAPTIDFDQCSPHHAYDLFTHIACVTSAVAPDVTLRWAALLHDIGKVPTFRKDETGRGHFKQHAPVGAEMADVVLRRLHAPNALREEAVWLIANHMLKIPKDAPGMRRMLLKHSKDSIYRLISLQAADMISKGMGEDDRHEHFAACRATLDAVEPIYLKDLAIDGNDLMALGYTGKSIGDQLNELFELVLDEKLPNEKEALLKAAVV